MSKQDELDKVAQTIIKDKVCPGLASTATQLVPGDGNPDADIVFIGEAPGQNEDLQGKPFVGAAGKFLNEMLENIGLKREDIFITNIVKYRPPNNRDPLPEEKAVFMPYLLQQLEIIKPSLIVTLGRHSMEVFLPNFRISQIHGQPKRIKMLLSNQKSANSKQQKTDDTQVQQTLGEPSSSSSKSAGDKRSKTYDSYDERESQLARLHAVTTPIVILPLYHPAAALYNGAMRTTLIEDFSLIPQILETIKKQVNSHEAV